MAKLLRFKPFVFLIVAWLAGLARLHAWAADTEARAVAQDSDVVALSMSSASSHRARGGEPRASTARGTILSPAARVRGHR